MKAHVVLYHTEDQLDVEVLGVYVDEEKASRLVGFERMFIEDENHDCWYQTTDLKDSEALLGGGQ